jgi:zinc transport system substrate-binding protein
LNNIEEKEDSILWIFSLDKPMHLKFLFLLLLISCGKVPLETNSPEKKATILVSLAPYKPLVEKIAGETWRVETIVPVGTNPHTYEPTIRQINALGQGALWFRIGEPFEQKILPVLRQNKPDLMDIDLRTGVTLLQGSGCHCHAEALEDRHIWLSPQALLAQVYLIADTLAQKYPENKEIFLENRDALISELTHLDNELKTILDKAEHRSFLVSHPAFAYFCKDYHLEQLSIEFNGKEPTSKHATKIMQEAVDSKTTLAIAMPQHSNKGLELVAQKLHLKTHVIDPYAPDSFETMRSLAHLVADNE